MAGRGRTLDVLLALVDAPTGLPFIGAGIVDAYQAGIITAGEAKILQQHSRRSWRVQKRMLAQAKPVTDADIATMRAKLESQARRLGIDLTRPRGSTDVGPS